MKEPESYAEFLALPDAEREEPVVLRSCSICNWTNVSLINLGEPNKPRMVCQGCCKRALETMGEILALTQNPADEPRPTGQERKL